MNTCKLCGSADLQKADEIMATALPLTKANWDAAMAQRKEVSALRAPHMNRECAK